MELKVWWDEDSDEATFIRTREELGAFRAHAGTIDYPVLFEMLDAAEPHRVILDVGVNGDRGVLYYAGGEHRDGCYSKNPEATGPELGMRLYYYMSSDREFPVSAEYPVDTVWQACEEFIASGGARPTVVDWQPKSAVGN